MYRNAPTEPLTRPEIALIIGRETSTPSWRLRPRPGRRAVRERRKILRWRVFITLAGALVASLCYNFPLSARLAAPQSQARRDAEVEGIEQAQERTKPPTGVQELRPMSSLKERESGWASLETIIGVARGESPARIMVNLTPQPEGVAVSKDAVVGGSPYWRVTRLKGQYSVRAWTSGSEAETAAKGDEAHLQNFGYRSPETVFNSVAIQVPLARFARTRFDNTIDDPKIGVTLLPAVDRDTKP